MLKKTIEYVDFNGTLIREDHYFHLTKADLVEMEMSHRGGLHQHLQAMVASEDGKAIITEFKQLILMSYGKRSEDGKRFIKTQELRDEFVSSEAYSSLFMELCTNAEAAADFVNGIVPADLEKDLAKLTAVEPAAEPDGVHLLTLAEARAMDGAQLEHGLATGRYKLKLT